MEVIYILVAGCTFICLVCWFFLSLGGLSGGISELIGELFFNLESWERIVKFFFIAIFVGILYATYISCSGTPEGFGKVVLKTLTKSILIALIAVTIVNAVYAFFRLDKEPKDRERYTEKDRKKDLKKIEAKKTEAAEIFSKCSISSSKPWHTGY